MSSHNVKGLPVRRLAHQVSMGIFNAGHLFALIADRLGELGGGDDDKMEQVISVAMAGRDMCQQAQVYADHLEDEVHAKEADHGR